MSFMGSSSAVCFFMPLSMTFSATMFFVRAEPLIVPTSTWPAWRWGLVVCERRFSWVEFFLFAYSMNMWQTVIIFNHVSCFKFTSLWHSLVTSCSVIFGHRSILLKILVLISASSEDCRLHTSTRHLNWSVIDDNLKHSHSRFTKPACFTQSSSAAFVIFSHW